MNLMGKCLKDCSIVCSYYWFDLKSMYYYIVYNHYIVRSMQIEWKVKTNTNKDMNINTNRDRNINGTMDMFKQDDNEE